MKFISLFSGAGMIDLALVRAGWECVAQVEIDEKCQSLLRRHFPGVPKFRDVRDVRGADLGAAELVCGGSPCQGLSLAGRRGGLADERSGLFHELVRVADEVAAPWLLWENVFGALSSPPGTTGEDFACVLEGITGFRPQVPEGGWRNSGVCVGPKRAAAWRVLDSQYVGGCALHVRESGRGPVPQRRRRVFVVARAGDSRGLVAEESFKELCRLAGLSCAVLFEPDCDEGYPPACREERQDTAATLRSRSASVGVSMPGRGGEDDSNLVVANGITSHYGRGPDSDATDTFVCGTLNGGGNDGGFRTEPGEHIVVGSLDAQMANGGDDHAAQANHIVAYQCHGSNVGPMGTLRSGNGNTAGGVPFIVNAAESCAKESHAREADVARSLDTTGSFASNQGGTVAVTPIDMRQASRGETMTNNRPEGSSGGAPGTGIGEAGDPSPTLADTHTPAVVVGTLQAHDKRHGHAMTTQQAAEAGQIVAHTLRAEGADASEDGTGRGTPLVVAFQERGREGGRNVESQEDLAYSLNAPAGGGRRQEMNIATRSVVRRLTPLECERLMGLPDNWTAVDDEGKPLSDSARYRIIGNGVVRQVLEWIGARLKTVAEANP